MIDECGQLKVLSSGGEIVLSFSNSVITKNQYSEILKQTDIKNVVYFKKFGNRTDYDAVIINPSDIEHDYFMNNNCSIVSVVPHIDNPYASAKHYMRAFFDDTIPWRTKLIIEFEQIDMDQKDLSGFEIMYSLPSDGASSVPSNTKNVFIYFNSKVFADSVNNDSVVVTEGGVLVDDYSVFVNPENEASIVIEFQRSFSQYSVIDVTITDQLTNTSGVQTSGLRTISFTIGVVTKLLVSGVDPANNTVNVSQDKSITVDFNSNIDMASINNLSVSLRSGIIINSLNFNTSSDYIEIPFKQQMNVSELSISFVVRFSSLVNQNILSRNLADDVVPYDIRIVDKKIRFGVLVGGLWSFVDSQVLTVNKIYTIVVTYKTKSVEITNDGVIIGAGTILYDLQSNYHNLWIGKFIGNIESPHASFGCFTMWNKQLTASQITQVRIGFVPLPDNLIFRYEFNEQSGPLIVDSSANKNNGMLINGSEYSRGSLSETEFVPVYYTKNGDRSITITPLYYMASGETHWIKLNSNVSDTSGNFLSVPFESRFVTENIVFGAECARYVGGPNSSIGMVFNGKISESNVTIILKLQLYQMASGQKIFSHGTKLCIYVDSANTIAVSTYGVKRFSVIFENRNEHIFLAFTKNGIDNNLSIYDKDYSVIGTGTGQDTKSESWDSAGFFGINESLTLAALVGFVYIYGVVKNSYQIRAILTGSSDSYCMLRKFMHNETTGNKLTDYSVNGIDGTVKNYTDADFWGRTFS